MECGWPRATGLSPQQVSTLAQNVTQPPCQGPNRGQPAGPQPSHQLHRHGPLPPKGGTESCSGLCPGFVSGPKYHLPASWRRGFRNLQAYSREPREGSQLPLSHTAMWSSRPQAPEQTQGLIPYNGLIPGKEGVKGPQPLPGALKSISLPLNLHFLAAQAPAVLGPMPTRASHPKNGSALVELAVHPRVWSQSP